MKAKVRPTFTRSLSLRQATSVSGFGGADETLSTKVALGVGTESYGDEQTNRRDRAEWGFPEYGWNNIHDVEGRKWHFNARRAARAPFIPYLLFEEELPSAGRDMKNIH